jgi:hypothetical protein
MDISLRLKFTSWVFLVLPVRVFKDSRAGLRRVFGNRIDHQLGCGYKIIPILENDDNFFDGQGAQVILKEL